MTEWNMEACKMMRITLKPEIFELFTRLADLEVCNDTSWMIIVPSYLRNEAWGRLTDVPSAQSDNPVYAELLTTIKEIIAELNVRENNNIDYLLFVCEY